MLTNSQANAFVRSDPQAQAAFTTWRAQNPNATGADFTAWASQLWQASGKPAPQNYNITETPTVQPGMFGPAQSPSGSNSMIDAMNARQGLNEQMKVDNNTWSQGLGLQRDADRMYRDLSAQLEGYDDPVWKFVRSLPKGGAGMNLDGMAFPKIGTNVQDIGAYLKEKYGTANWNDYAAKFGLTQAPKGTGSGTGNVAQYQAYLDSLKGWQPGMLTGASGGSTGAPVTGGNTGVPVTDNGGAVGGSGGSSGSFSGASSGGGTGMLGNNATWTRPVSPTGMFPTVQDSSAWQAQYPQPRGLFS